MQQVTITKSFKSFSGSMIHKLSNGLQIDEALSFTMVILLEFPDAERPYMYQVIDVFTSVDDALAAAQHHS